MIGAVVDLLWQEQIELSEAVADVDCLDRIGDERNVGRIGKQTMRRGAQNSRRVGAYVVHPY